MDTTTHAFPRDAVVAEIFVDLYSFICLTFGVLLVTVLFKTKERFSCRLLWKASFVIRSPPSRCVAPGRLDNGFNNRQYHTADLLSRNLAATTGRGMGEVCSRPSQSD